MRGLKLPEAEIDKKPDSRTLTGAWIETKELEDIATLACVAPSRVRGLKQNKIEARLETLGSHPHGCVD